MQKKQLWLICICLVSALVLAVSQLWNEALPAGAWGLSFPEAGQPPNAPASPEILKNYDAFYLGNPEEKTIYLTFDAGYENGCTGKILDILKEKQVPAAFFLTGNYLEKNADLVRRMVAEGHIVGNHTMHHPKMDKIADPAAFSKELTDLEALYTQITGEQMPKFYRPPQGIYNEENLKNAKTLGYKTIFWSLAYVDWLENQQPTRDAALGKLLPRLHPGAVILLHSTSQTNVAILEEFINACQQQGYRFASLNALA